MKDELKPDMHSEVQRYYGETLSSSEDLKTTACCTAAAPPKYLSRALSEVHDEVLQRYYGCGLVLPEALEGLKVLDLGCGAGRDVYVLSRLVGPAGRVVGVDMTAAQLDVAERYRDWHADIYGYTESNVEFIQGNIEELGQTGLGSGEFDLIVSNCVINLAVDKAAVLNDAFRLLAPGGEMYFSDIYADRRIPTELATDPVLYGECLAGALYSNDFIDLAHQCGFADPRLLEHEPVVVTDELLSKRLGDIKFCSATYRLFKTAGLEANQEDYGQTAVYLGTIPEYEQLLLLDASQQFPAGEQVPISGNTAKIISNSRFKDHFEIIGDIKKHLGEFKSLKQENLFVHESDSSAANSCC